MRPRFLLVPFLLLAACNESPTEPRRGTLELRMSCRASGSNVECFAWTFGQGFDRIVTDEASWLHEGAPGSFAKPGLFVPSSNGEVAIWVTCQGIVQDLRARTRTYRVDPPVGADGNPPFLGFQLAPLQ